MINAGKEVAYQMLLGIMKLFPHINVRKKAVN